VRGPAGPNAPALLLVLKLRRYRCLPCGAVILVGPRELLPRRHYSAAAIGFALALYGLVLATAREVRRRISPQTILGATAFTGWATLRRWTRAVAHRRLFPALPSSDPSAMLRRVAASAAASLAAYADPTSRGEALEHRAFLGAAHAA
jgi:hypothetical protein